MCSSDLFDENIYVVDTRKRFSQGRSNVLQEEDDENISLEEEVCEEEDKSLSLGMSMQPQEEDNEEQKDEENDEQLETEERKHPPSPPMDEGDTSKTYLLSRTLLLLFYLKLVCFGYN